MVIVKQRAQICGMLLQRHLLVYQETRGSVDKKVTVYLKIDSFFQLKKYV